MRLPTLTDDRVRPGADLLSRLYAAGAARRRRQYMQRPGWRRMLAQPVVSVGNLAVGGSGKTPLVAHLAELMRQAGERPAILSRGYGRAVVDDGVVVVRDADGMRADLWRAGDEPVMLARGLPGTIVAVAEDRYLAGRLAERRLGATIHLLDDGFQHLGLDRDVDLLLVSPGDLQNGRVMPAGRLREPIETARAADALIVTDGTAGEVAEVTRQDGGQPVFVLQREEGVPRLIEPHGQPPRVPRSAPTVAVAGIARPERFFDAVRASGWAVVATRAFPDHHRYEVGDARLVAQIARDHGAALVLTTEKDAVRWMPLRPLPLPMAWVPMHAHVEPADDFQVWLADRVARARARREALLQPVGC